MFALHLNSFEILNKTQTLLTHDMNHLNLSYLLKERAQIHLCTFWLDAMLKWQNRVRFELQNILKTGFVFKTREARNSKNFVSRFKRTFREAISQNVLLLEMLKSNFQFSSHKFERLVSPLSRKFQKINNKGRNCK